MASSHGFDSHRQRLIPSICGFDTFILFVELNLIKFDNYVFDMMCIYFVKIDCNSSESNALKKEKEKRSKLSCPNSDNESASPCGI